ncbi:PQQ-dependent sugar dehydrogenase [Hyphobacterium sp. CCMP332]|nr:PQQ-dependent sugar dehydrogenase [Hyphobacterium sp. CCMP332]
MKKLLLITFSLLTFNFSLFSQPIIDLETFATGFTRPVDIQSPGGNDSRLFIVEQAGKIWILDSLGNKNSTPFLDISNQVNSTGNEQGLLGIAFPPDFASNPNFIVHYTALDGSTQISLFPVSNDPDSADPNAEFPILNEPQPYSNHNGGSIAFGPDGYLYVALGDGGSAGDPGNRSQDLTTVLGKILRINLNTAMPYGIPPDNPFVGMSTFVREEIWAYGLRNPWKMSFDRQTGDLWIGDVGQDAKEEIDFQPFTSTGGENYGWRCYEGTSSYNLNNCPPDSTMTDPVYEYAHNSGGCSVTGGVVYRGSRYPGLYGRYFFADICPGWISSLDGNFNVTNHGTFSSSNYFVAFGEDNKGEVFVAGLYDGKISRIIESTNSLQNSERNDLKFYPNPSNGNLNIELVQVPTNTLKLFNLSGVLEFESSLNSKINSVDISHLRRGIYIYELELNNDMIQGKLIIEN